MIDVDISDKLTPDKEPTMAANTPEYKRLNKRKEVLKETIGEIKEAKQDRRDTAPGGVTEKRKVFAELGEKRKLNRVVEVSRSKRDKKPIIIQVSSSHNLSPRQMFNLEVDKSTIRGKDVGEGVFNSGKVIPEGTVFGPYTGNFITVAEYEEMEKAGLESGNAWEIRDKDNEKTVGYIGPGIKPDSTVHWMAKVNCAITAYDQNLVGFQLAGQVYYRAIVDIELGGELMVFYGETYASEMGINVKIYEKYVGKEDQTKEAVSCKYCKSTFEDEKKLEEHLEKGKNMAYRCGVKQTMEMVRMAEVGDRRYVCRMCGKGFKSSSLLNIHGLVHSKLKAFLCKVAGCGKAFTGKSSAKKVMSLGTTRWFTYRRSLLSVTSVVHSSAVRRGSPATQSLFTRRSRVLSVIDVTRGLARLLIGRVTLSLSTPTSATHVPGVKVVRT